MFKNSCQYLPSTSISQWDSQPICLASPHLVKKSWGVMAIRHHPPSDLRCAMPVSPCSRGRFFPPAWLRRVWALHRNWSPAGRMRLGGRGLGSLPKSWWKKWENSKIRHWRVLAKIGWALRYEVVLKSLQILMGGIQSREVVDPQTYSNMLSRYPN